MKSELKRMKIYLQLSDLIRNHQNSAQTVS